MEYVQRRRSQQRSLALLAATVCVCSARQPSQHYPLPAPVVFRDFHNDSGAATLGVCANKPIAEEDKKTCESITKECARFHLTEAQVRQRFATYSALTPKQHDVAEHESGCSWGGTLVTPEGKTFPFSTTESHLLTTTWPDGKRKEIGSPAPDPPLPVRIKGTNPPLLLSWNGKDKLTYLTGEAQAGGKQMQIALTKPWVYGEWASILYHTERIGGVPGHFIVFTESYSSNPANIQGRCGGAEETFLHVVSLTGTPHETFAVQVVSCLRTEDVQDAKWDQTARTLRAYIPGHPTITFHVSPEGELTPTPPKPIYSK